MHSNTQRPLSARLCNDQRFQSGGEIGGGRFVAAERMRVDTSAEYASEEDPSAEDSCEEDTSAEEHFARGTSAEESPAKYSSAAAQPSSVTSSGR